MGFLYNSYNRNLRSYNCFDKNQNWCLYCGAWLVLIAITRIASGKFPDVAVSDLVMAIDADSLTKITEITDASNA
jgi:hypothetical protein